MRGEAIFYGCENSIALPIQIDMLGLIIHHTNNRFIINRGSAKMDIWMI